jgi:hypothetical protein
MDAATAKKFVEENIRYDQLKALLVKLLRFPSPQTELLEAEPQVRALIREVIRLELEEAGVIMTSSLSQKSTTRPKSSPSWHCTDDGLGDDLITPPALPRRQTVGAAIPPLLDHTLPGGY